MRQSISPVSTTVATDVWGGQALAFISPANGNQRPARPRKLAISGMGVNSCIWWAVIRFQSLVRRKKAQKKNGVIVSNANRMTDVSPTPIFANFANASWRDHSSLTWVAWWISERRGKRAYWDRPASSMEDRTSAADNYTQDYPSKFIVQGETNVTLSRSFCLECEVNGTAELAFVPGNAP